MRISHRCCAINSHKAIKASENTDVIHTALKSDSNKHKFQETKYGDNIQAGNRIKIWGWLM
jgi:hypothetical protein